MQSCKWHTIGLDTGFVICGYWLEKGDKMVICLATFFKSGMSSQHLT